MIKMEPEIVIRGKNGAIWKSYTQRDRVKDVLRECLRNKHFDDNMKEVANILIDRGIDGITVTEKNGIVKILSTKPKCKITVSLENPAHKTVANGFGRLYAAYASKMHGPGEENSEKYSCQDVNFGSEDDEDIAQTLSKMGVDDRNPALIRIAKMSLKMRGTMPDELIRRSSRNR